MKTLLTIILLTMCSVLRGIPLNHEGFEPGSGFELEIQEDGIRVYWNSPEGKAFLDLDLERKFRGSYIDPLIREVGIDGKTVLEGLEPNYIFWVGDRDLEKRDGWSVFFDRVPNKPYSTEKGLLLPDQATVSRHGGRVTIEIGPLKSINFSGTLCFTLYDGSPFIHMEARVSTQRPATAFLYHAGLSKREVASTHMHWIDADGVPQSAPSLNNQSLDPARLHWTDTTGYKLAVTSAENDAQVYRTRFRSMAMSSETGSVAISPFPHQFLYPLDFVDNYGYNWAGNNYLGMIGGFSWGVRQPPLGDRRYTPWVNTPPGSEQRLGTLLFVSKRDGEHNLNTVKRYTRGDSFKPLPGYKTLSSHFHIEHSFNYLKKQAEQNTDGIPAGLESPEFVTVFKDMGVDMVHLAEFHFGATPKMDTLERLEQLKVMHAECERLSGDGFLLLPGEEPNVHFGGHWMSFFPKPINWVLNRNKNQPFQQEMAGYGTVYHVGSAEDILELLKRENGLAWTAHARIKGSTGYPDNYKETDFFKSDQFLGAAWKAMPSDYSRNTLGWRALNLQDDMSNWGDHKHTLGEVDIFRIYRDYELYGAMNINYLKLDEVPEFEDGWQPVLDAMRAGQFFVTTGEVLITDWTVGGKDSGETLTRKADLSSVVLNTQLEWTYPLSHLEIVSGNGTEVFRKRIDLSDTKEFGEREVNQHINLTNRTWVRMEVWDIARNGAFTQPVWIQ